MDNQFQIPYLRSDHQHVVTVRDTSMKSRYITTLRVAAAQICVDPQDNGQVLSSVQEGKIPCALVL